MKVGEGQTIASQRLKGGIGGRDAGVDGEEMRLARFSLLVFFLLIIFSSLLFKQKEFVLQMSKGRGNRFETRFR